MGSKFQNFPVRLKLAISHSLLGALAVVVAAVAIMAIKNQTGHAEQIYTESAYTKQVVEIRYALTDMEKALAFSMLHAEGNAELKQAVETNAAAAMEGAKILQASLQGTSGEAMMNDFIAKLNESERLKDQMMSSMEAGNVHAAHEIYEASYEALLKELQGMTQELYAAAEGFSAGYYEDAMREGKLSVYLVIVLSILCLLSGYLIVRVVSRIIRTPILQLKEASEAMSKGDLSVSERITYTSKDEFGALADSLRGTVGMLDEYIQEIGEVLQKVAQGDLTTEEREITAFQGDFKAIRESILYILQRLNLTMHNISNAADQVTSGSEQIASGSQVLASGAAEQAGAIKELSMTAQMISEQVNTTAGNATDAMRHSDDTSEKVTICNEQMQEMMAAMQEINQHSDSIGKIVKTIEDIAFQTNILALNAAVEAARAGAAGKGFAVVADEVRNLASKSAEASQSTSELIGETVQAVAKGSSIAAETAASLTEVVEGTKSVTGLVEQIANAANEQAEALTQLNVGIAQISSVIETTSATAEESASAGEELSGQAEVLKNLIHQFHLRS